MSNTLRSALSKATIQGVISLALTGAVIGGFFQGQISGEALLGTFGAVVAWAFKTNAA
jgi:hypothetical protein